MESRPPLPEPFESELTRLLDGPEEEFWPAVARMCQQHPERAKEIRRVAEAIEASGRSERTRIDAGDSAAGVVAGVVAEVNPGDHVGPFTVLAEIGHGGMGSVLLAEQKQPVQRRVALKVIKLGMDTRGVLARWRTRSDQAAQLRRTMGSSSPQQRLRAGAAAGLGAVGLPAACAPQASLRSQRPRPRNYCGA